MLFVFVIFSTPALITGRPAAKQIKVEWRSVKAQLAIAGWLAGWWWWACCCQLSSLGKWKCLIFICHVVAAVVFSLRLNESVTWRPSLAVKMRRPRCDKFCPHAFVWLVLGLLTSPPTKTLYVRSILIFKPLALRKGEGCWVVCVWWFIFRTLEVNFL